MKFSQWIESSERILYHVTKTSNIPSIQKKGIIPFQTSNWVKAANKKRYGGGKIFACESLVDAARWAFNMDWTLNKEIGTGKISIISFKDGDAWEIDDADPISQSGNKGKWLKRDALVLPDRIMNVKPFDEVMIKLLK